MIETYTQIKKLIVWYVGKIFKKSIYHFMLHCTAYKEERSHQSIHLKQPYIECEENILGHFLFDKENIKYTPQTAIYRM